jgi:phosphonate transport system permease protein
MRANSQVTPPRFRKLQASHVAILLVLFFLIYPAFQGAEVSPTALIEGAPYMQEVLFEMFPPDLKRLPNILSLLVSTFHMAVAGTILGILLSLPLAILGARKTSPHIFVYQVSRLIVSLARTIPDLVWALFFVVTVGIGPFAGVLTIAVDTLGFCGRFFAEGIEETEEHPREALETLGATRSAILAIFILPSAAPSFINTALFSLEKAVRSSVVLGLVGAGGIGVELKVAMDTFRYDEACTIILAIFTLVILVEQISMQARKRMIST